MSHPTEEDLVLHHYGEGMDRAAIEAHLESCDPCRAALASLEADLAAVEAEEVPERGEAYGSEVWERLRPKLVASGALGVNPGAPTQSRWLRDRGAGAAEVSSGVPSRPRAAFFRQPWVMASGMAACLVLAFLLGRHLPESGGSPVSSRVRERILFVAVGDHLERSQMVLIELANAGGEGAVDISSEQRSAEQLVAANRLFRQSAAHAGELGMASVLEDLERVLMEVAHSPSQISPADLQDIQKRIEGRGLLFKVRVIGSQVRGREKEAVPIDAGLVS